MNIRNHLLGPLGNSTKRPKEAVNNDGEIPFKELLKQFFKKQKEKLKLKKRSTLIAWGILLLLTLYVVGVITSLLQVATHLNFGHSAFNKGAESSSPEYHVKLLPWEALLCIFNFPYSIFAFIIVGTLIALGFYRWIRNHVALGEYTIEERAGATYKKQLQDATMGSAREMNDEEIKKNFLVLTPKELKKDNPHTLIFGSLPETGEFILEKPVGKKDVPNRNCFVVGDAGSWKTSNFIVTNIKQLAKRGDNCVCTDSSGEVFALTYQDFKDNDYEIYVINTTDTEHSDTMNFIGAVGNDLDLAKTVTQTLVESTHKPTDKVDVFFEDGMKTLLPAIIIIVNTELKDYSSIEGIIRFLIRYDTPEKMKEVFETWKDKQKEAYKQFSLFMMSPVRDNFISNLAQRLDLFVSEGISHICSKDGFNIIDRLGTEKKTVVFIITDKTYAFIAALFLNIISKILVDYAKKKCEGRILPRKLYFYFEEFLTMGYVPNMGTFLSENRKFGFVYYLICQAIPQFFLRYDEREAKEIMSNCMYKFFYGTGDTDTAELFEKYCGDTTVRTAMTSYSNQIIKDKDQAREGVQQRKLYDYNELITLDLDKLILFTTHEHPLTLKKPFYKTIPGSEPAEDFKEYHFSEFEPHKEEQAQAEDESDVNTASCDNDPDANPPSPKPDGKPKEPDDNPEKKEKEPPANNIPDSGNDDEPPAAPAESKPQKPERRGRPSKSNKMNDMAACNLITKYEELPINRPCINEEEVCESTVGNYHLFKNKVNRNGDLIRANKVTFDIDPEVVNIGGKLMSNEYCTYNTKYEIEKMQDTMQLSMEGHILVGFSRTTINDDKKPKREYLFDSPDPKEHKISVPKSDIVIRPIFRAIPGYSGTPPKNQDSDSAVSGKSTGLAL